MSSDNALGPAGRASIAEFRPEQTEELVLMWRESFEHGVGITDPHPLQEQRNYLANVVIPGNAIRVALLEGRIVGFVAASASSVAQLYVRKGFHRQGIGTLLLEWAKAQSSGSLWLCTFQRNAVARAFYERNGFRIAARGFEPNWQLEDLRYEWAASERSTQREPRVQQIEPFFREAGTGPGVVCTHSNASNSGQWRGLMDRLAPKFRVFAPDSYGSGKSPDWHSDRVIRLEDEAAFIEPVLARAGAPLALVGHSYGAAVALVVALANPGRVRAMALYEPTLFSLLDAESPPPNEAEGIRGAVANAANALDAGNRDAAAGYFIDYWMGAGAWEQTPEQRKPPIAASVTNVRRWAHALLTEPTPLAAFRALDVPVLYMLGKRSTQSAHGVARLLTAALPRVEVVEFEELGHMGPITHPDPVNEAIARFLERT